MRGLSSKIARRIVVLDDVPPEANAMIQALYSRSPKSVTEHLKKVKETGPEKFMENFYVGYGHKSIGDCGTTSIFVENVSMLAAKAIQDWPLYNGQEASTRYLDFKNQPTVIPYVGDAGLIIRNWMDFYEKAIVEMTKYLMEKHPLTDGIKKGIHKKAIQARAFDICRGFLPAGSTTYVSWHTNLRQAYDHLKQLHHHPLEEVRTIASEIHTELKEKYSSSFLHKSYPLDEQYIEETSASFTYDRRRFATEFKFSTNLFDCNTILNDSDLLKALKDRPSKSELPHVFKEFGNIKFQFPLDFGSYRDLQRHRSAYQPMPRLTMENGFDKWYLDSLTEPLRLEALELLNEQETSIDSLMLDPDEEQYLIPMGYRIPVTICCSLPSATYIAELRSAQTVHPTLRVRAQQMGDALKNTIPDMAIYHDQRADVWNVARGFQDIVEIDNKKD